MLVLALQNICPRLVTAAEAIVKGCEKCRDAFTSISNIVLEEDGKILFLTFSDVEEDAVLDVSLDMRLTIEDTDTISSRDDVKCAFGFGTSKEKHLEKEELLKRPFARSNASVFGAKSCLRDAGGCCRQRRCQ